MLPKRKPEFQGHRTESESSSSKRLKQSNEMPDEKDEVIEHSAHQVASLVLTGTEKNIMQAVTIVEQDPTLLNRTVIVIHKGVVIKGKPLQIAAIAGDCNLTLHVEAHQLGAVERLAAAAKLSPQEIADQLQVITSTAASTANKKRKTKIMNAVKAFTKAVYGMKYYSGKLEEEGREVTILGRPISLDEFITKFCAEIVDIFKKALEPNPNEIIDCGFIFDPRILLSAMRFYEEDATAFGYRSNSLEGDTYWIVVIGTLQRMLSARDAQVIQTGLSKFDNNGIIPDRNDLINSNLNANSVFIYSGDLMSTRQQVGNYIIPTMTDALELYCVSKELVLEEIRSAKTIKTLFLSKHFENHVLNLPKDLSLNVTQFLDLKTLIEIVHTNSFLHHIYAKRLALKQVLEMIVNYKWFDSETYQTAPFSRALIQLMQNVNNVNVGTAMRALTQQAINCINPTFTSIDKLIQKFPEIIYERDYVTDYSGQQFFHSPWQAAYWSQYYLMKEYFLLAIERNSVLKANIIKSQSQIDTLVKATPLEFITITNITPNMNIKIDKISGNTQLTLLRILDDNDRVESMYLWRCQSSNWSTLKLTPEESLLFNNIPLASDKLLLKEVDNADTITSLLRKHHCVDSFDLTQFIFMTRKYFEASKEDIDPLNPEEPAKHLSAFTKKFDDLWQAMGLEQLKFPAWIAVLMCYVQSSRENSGIANPNRLLLIKYPKLDVFEKVGDDSTYTCKFYDDNVHEIVDAENHNRYVSTMYLTYLNTNNSFSRVGIYSDLDNIPRAPVIIEERLKQTQKSMLAFSHTLFQKHKRFNTRYELVLYENLPPKDVTFKCAP